MSLRIYLRLLRPVPSAIWIAINTFGAFALGRAIFLQTQATARFIALGLILPCLVGAGIANAAHTVMHQPMFPLLPDGLRRVRNATRRALTAATLVCALLAAEFGSAPLVGEFGVAAALLSVSLLDRRSGPAALAALAGFAVLLAEGEHLIAPMAAAPWAFLAGGCIVSLTCLSLGFSSRHVRSRAGTPFIALSQFPAFNPGSAGRAARQAAQARARSATKLPRREWRTGRVGHDTWSWMKVFWFASGQSALARMVFFGSLVGVYTAFAAAFLMFLFGRLHTMPAFTWKDFWAALAHVGDPRFFGPESNRTNALPTMLLGIQAVFLVLTPASAYRPRLAYPISRRRMADVIFGAACVQMALALVLFVLMCMAYGVIGHVLGQIPFQRGGLLMPLLVAARLMPFLPLLGCAGSARTSFARIATAVPLGFAAVGFGLADIGWAVSASSVAGLSTLIGATAVTLFLLRYRLRRYYARCDLIAEIETANVVLRPTPVFSFNATTARTG